MKSHNSKKDLEKAKKLGFINEKTDKDFGKEIEKRLEDSIQKSKKSISKNQKEFTKNKDFTKLFKIYSTNLELYFT